MMLSLPATDDPLLALVRSIMQQRARQKCDLMVREIHCSSISKGMAFIPRGISETDPKVKTLQFKPRGDLITYHKTKNKNHTI